VQPARVSYNSPKYCEMTPESRDSEFNVHC
jgi:hypothetical protein